MCIQMIMTPVLWGLQGWEHGAIDQWNATTHPSSFYTFFGDAHSD